MRDYIPGDDAGKILWLENFRSWLTAYGATHGFTPAEISAFVTASGAASFAVTNNQTSQALARSTTAAKNTAIAAAIALARDDAQRIQTYPTTTDAERAAAGHDVAYDERNSTPSRKAAKDPCVHGSWRLCAFASWRSSPVCPKSSTPSPTPWRPRTPTAPATSARTSSSAPSATPWSAPSACKEVTSLV